MRLSLFRIWIYIPLVFFIAFQTSLSKAQNSSNEAPLVICWADWDPSYVLEELSRDFTKKTSIEVQFELESWSSYAERFSATLDDEKHECDILFGDSQWIGGVAEKGQYVKLNDFIEREKVSIERFVPAALEAYSVWPKGSKNYWAIPAMGDAVGWSYRKDWFI